MNEADIGTTIDALYAMRERRLGIERQVKEMKEAELTLRGKIFELLASMGLTKASGAVATAGIKVSNVPLVEDWDKLWQHIIFTGSTDLVQKRISVTAWRERFEDGQEVPGVSKVEDVDISFDKSIEGYLMQEYKLVMTFMGGHIFLTYSTEYGQDDANRAGKHIANKLGAWFIYSERIENDE